LDFLRAHRHAVEASAAPGGGAQAAVVGIAVSDDFELVFDTLASTRKAKNLARDPGVAFVIGGLLDGEEQTIQYQGIADRPSGAALDRVQRLYLHTFPDGDERINWPGLIYIRVTPTWLRYSDYRTEPPVIEEFSGAQLEVLR
jgi:hypothetical protein